MKLGPISQRLRDLRTCSTPHLLPGTRGSPSKPEVYTLGTQLHSDPLLYPDNTAYGCSMDRSVENAIPEATTSLAPAQWPSKSGAACFTSSACRLSMNLKLYFSCLVSLFSPRTVTPVFLVQSLLFRVSFISLLLRRCRAPSTAPVRPKKLSHIQTSKHRSSSVYSFGRISRSQGGQKRAVTM